jgi:hypothetical protein
MTDAGSAWQSNRNQRSRSYNVPELEIIHDEVEQALGAEKAQKLRQVLHSYLTLTQLIQEKCRSSGGESQPRAAVPHFSRNRRQLTIRTLPGHAVTRNSLGQAHGILEQNPHKPNPAATPIWCCHCPSLQHCPPPDEPQPVVVTETPTTTFCGFEKLDNKGTLCTLTAGGLRMPLSSNWTDRRASGQARRPQHKAGETPALQRWISDRSLNRPVRLAPAGRVAPSSDAQTKLSSSESSTLCRTAPRLPLRAARHQASGDRRQRSGA